MDRKAAIRRAHTLQGVVHKRDLSPISEGMGAQFFNEELIEDHSARSTDTYLERAEANKGKLRKGVRVRVVELGHTRGFPLQGEVLRRRRTGLGEYIGKVGIERQVWEGLCWVYNDGPGEDEDRAAPYATGELEVVDDQAATGEAGAEEARATQGEATDTTDEARKG